MFVHGCMNQLLLLQIMAATKFDNIIVGDWDQLFSPTQETRSRLIEDGQDVGSDDVGHHVCGGTVFLDRSVTFDRRPSTADAISGPSPNRVIEKGNRDHLCRSQQEPLSGWMGSQQRRWGPACPWTRVSGTVFIGWSNTDDRQRTTMEPRSGSTVRRLRPRIVRTSHGIQIYIR